jgi:bifunctional UDP-N-acetylglucosamine pyrophosphorylase / glucosamine-1-phosphate N-acetyltransferase
MNAAAVEVPESRYWVNKRGSPVVAILWMSGGVWRQTLWRSGDLLGWRPLRYGTCWIGVSTGLVAGAVALRPVGQRRRRRLISGSLMTVHTPERELTIVVLAAGKGTRMKSSRPKVLHAVGGRSMLGHVLALTECVRAGTVAIVIGPGMDDVRAEVAKLSPRASVVVQHEQKGTADAVLAAKDVLRAATGDCLVLYADTPLIEAATIDRLRAALAAGAGVAVLGFEAADPTGYGRLLTDGSGKLVAIREEKDATPQERAVRLCNSGVMAFALTDTAGVLERIGNANAKGEFYLTDAVEIARGDGAVTAVVACPETEVLGVNSRDQLAQAERLFQTRMRGRAMAEGATLVAPETVWFSFDTKIGRDVLIEPNVFFGPGVTVGDNVWIKANCHMEAATLRDGVQIGPFARLRPGAELGEAAHVGNLVEIKNARLGRGAKANHLAYVGDAEVGAAANIGAGTILCNYDGFNKHKTEIGEGAFIGSNSSLVAPVKIGAGAYIGSGSVITKTVAPGSLALSRAPQEERLGWAEKFRTMMGRRKP